MFLKTINSNLPFAQDIETLGSFTYKKITVDQALFTIQ